MIRFSSSLVGINWLAQNLEAENLVVLDASVPPVVPGYVSVNTGGEFHAIPGARRFDYDQKIRKPNSALPHLIPTAELFPHEVRNLGIDRDVAIVVYDDGGMYGRATAWLMF